LSEIVTGNLEKGEELGRFSNRKMPLHAAVRVGDRMLVPQLIGRSVGIYDAADKKQLWSAEVTPAKRNTTTL